MAEFKFQIGDMVMAKTAIADCRAGGGGRPLHLLVTERMIHECPGGIQLKYLLSNSQSKDLVMPEDALMPALSADELRAIADDSWLSRIKQ